MQQLIELIDKEINVMEACIEGAIQENATQEVRDGLFFEWQRLRENIVSCMEKVKITENNLPTNIPEKE